MNPSVLCFGEVLWDLLPQGPALGGTAVNVACRLAALGRNPLMLSRLGTDELGERALALMRNYGVCIDAVQRDSVHPTGTVKIDLSDPTNPNYTIIAEVAYDYTEITSGILAAAAGAHAVYFGTLGQRAPVAAETLRQVLAALPAHAPRFLDINLRRDCYTPQSVRRALSEADILKINDEEVAVVAGICDLPASLKEFAATALERFGLKACLITLGAKGMFAADAAGDRVYLPGYRIRVADTIGSGDACAAAFLDRYLGGAPLIECCEQGNIYGAIAASQVGATTPITDEVVRNFRAHTPQRTALPDM